MDSDSNRMIGGMQLKKSDVKTFEFKTEDSKEKKKKKALEEQIMSVDQGARFVYQDQGSEDTPSPEMKNFGMSMRELMSFLATKTPSVVDTQSLEQGCDKADEIYRSAIEKAELCLKNPESYGHDPQIKSQIEQTLESLKREAALFEKKIDEYRTMMTPTDEGTVIPDGTWSDVLRYDRALRFETGNTDGTTIKKTGSGSLYYRIERQGKDSKDIYLFRKQEDAPVEKSKELIRQYYRSLPKDTKTRRERREIFEALLVDQRDGKIGDVPFDKFYASLRRETARNIYRKITATNTETAEFLRVHPVDISLQFCDMIKGLSNTLFLRELTDSSGIKGGNVLSDRGDAASRMADMLGIGDLVQKSQTATVINKGKYVKGSVLEEDKGQKGNELAAEGAKYSQSALSKVFALQMFDFICGNCTRKTDGIGLKTEGRASIKGVKAVNNELSFGTLRYSEVKNGYGNLRPDDDINIKGMPSKMLNKLLRLEENSVRYALCDILDKKELDALIDRISGIKRKIMSFPGLKKDQGGQYYFETAKEDDDLRAFDQVQRRKEGLPDGKKMSDVSHFYDPLLSDDFNEPSDVDE